MKQGASRTHAIRVAIELRKRILSGEFQGGTRLFEVELAEGMDVSRTPVREAMSRLAEEGLLDRARGGGFTVRAFGRDDIIDAIELRGVLEGTAARLAAERGCLPDRLERFKDVVKAMDACFTTDPDDVDFDAYCDLNQQFHHQLAGLSGSEILRREVERVNHLPFASPAAFLPNNADIIEFRRSLRPAQDQHRELLGAILAREGFRAESIAREHARAARRNLDYLIVENPELISRVPGLALVVT
jgi:GntR family transcriptional regulator of vanillate catabolism